MVRIPTAKTDDFKIAKKPYLKPVIPDQIYLIGYNFPSIHVTFQKSFESHISHIAVYPMQFDHGFHATSPPPQGGAPPSYRLLFEPK